MGVRADARRSRREDTTEANRCAHWTNDRFKREWVLEPEGVGAYAL